MDFAGYEVLSFDCYGTLIDWETGIAEALRPLLARHGVELDDDALLELYARHEAAAEGEDYRPYADILRGQVKSIAAELGFAPGADEVETLVRSVGDWPAFADTAGALARLQRRFRLAILSNIDDDLFAASAPKLGVEFDWVVTAEQVGSYKPARANFVALLESIDVPAQRLVHVAQSLYHDVAPARRLGLATAWVNRRHGQEGFGATPPSDAVPDFEVPDLASLADAVEAAE